MHFGEPTIEDRLEGSIRQMLGWYLGDGAYGDGKYFQFDHYNGFVIQPMLVDVLSLLTVKSPKFAPAYNVVIGRARRYAEIQERMISPDATFPAVGRSISYRVRSLSGSGANGSNGGVAPTSETLPSALRAYRRDAANDGGTWDFR